jgi:hypothetical protein
MGLIYIAATWGVWVLGGLATLMLFHNKVKSVYFEPAFCIGSIIVAFGIGSSLALVLQGAVLWLLGGVEMRPIYPHLLKVWLVADVVMLATIIFLAASNHTVKEEKTNREAHLVGRSIFITILGVLISSLCMITVFMNIWSPLFAWDALHFWGYQSASMADSLSAPEFNGYHFKHRHPSGLIGLLAWWGWASANFSDSNGSLSLWLAFFMSGGLIVFGMWMMRTRNAILALLGLYVYLSTPITENHVAAAGYSEVVTGVLCMVMVFLVMQHQRNPSKSSALNIFFLLLASSFIKNISFIYGLLIVASAAMTGMLGDRVKFLAFALIVVAAVGLAFGFTISLGPSSVIWNPDQLMLYMGKRTLYFSTPSSEDLNLAISGVIQSLFVNLSFSSFWLICITIFLYAWIDLKRCGASPAVSSLFAQLTIILQTLVMFASIASDYGLRTAAIGSDTGFTRHLVPIIMTMMALFPAILRASSRSGVQCAGSS